MKIYTTLLEAIIMYSKNMGDVILDLFDGKSTIRVGVEKLGRNHKLR